MQPNPSIAAILASLPTTYHPKHKFRCTSAGAQWDLGAVESKNGTTQYKAYCTECLGKGGPISYDALIGLDTSTIKTIRSHEVIPCERCGSLDGSELHHWAPRYLFKDADAWPSSYLCQKCHTQWHRTVTPNMCVNDNAPKKEAA